MLARLHVAYLNDAVTDEELLQLFTPFGTVRSAQVTTDPHSGRSERCGIVEMGSEAEAEVAIDALDGLDYRGRRLFVDWATRRNESDAAHASMFGPMNMTADAPTHGFHGARRR
jgi:RNA recognition motif-containing protein